MPRLREFRWDSWAQWTHDEIAKDAPSIMAVDTETTGLGFYDEPFAATLTWRAPDGTMKSGYIELDDDAARPVSGAGVAPAGDPTRRRELLAAILNSVDTWVFHNAKFDLQKLILIGVLTADRAEQIELHDTQSAYVLLDENSTKGLKDLAVRVLKYDDTFTTVYKTGAKKGQVKEVPKEAHRLNEIRRKLGLKKDDGYHLLPREFLIPYALRDTEFTLQLHELLQPRLREVGDPRLLELYDDAMKRKLVLLRMEADAFALDIPYTEAKASEYGVRVMEKWDRVVSLVGDPDFNPRSPDQVMAAFKRRGVTVENTQAKTLQVLDDDLAVALLDYRDDFKIHGTYLLGLLREHRGGRVHPNFNDDGARTGRMSSSSAKE